MIHFTKRGLALLLLSAVLVACGDPQAPEQAPPPAAEQLPEEAVTESTADRDMVEDDSIQVVDEAAPEADTAAPADGGTLVAEEMVDDEPAEPATGPGVIHLAQAQGARSGDYQFTEGEHFRRLTPAQRTASGTDKIEVLDVFWYGCPACYQFEPVMRDLATRLPDGVEVVKMPVGWNEIHQLHARAYYVAQELDVVDTMHTAIFRAYHERGNRLQSEDSIRRLFRENGVSAEDFDRAWARNMSVDSAVNRATQLTRAGGRYGISGTPTVVVNGKYTVSPDRRGRANLDNMGDIILELVQRELNER